MIEKEKNTAELRFAVLIDGDNAQPSSIEHVLREVVKFGKITIRRIYGDWTTSQMESWKKYLPVNAIQPIQQFRNTIGKNATDSALIIDAMDILYSGNVDGFVIVSSDSDYTRLAIRLREEGKFVIGIGRQHTPNPFVKACDQFLFNENILKQEQSRRKSGNGGKENVRKSEPPRKDREKEKEKKEIPVSAVEELVAAVHAENPVDLVSEAYDMVETESDWKEITLVGHALKRMDPAFDTRTYGFAKLSRMIKSMGDAFDLKWDEERQNYLVRRKESERPADMEAGLPENPQG
jgi:uncharacterized protein (TIGR00288 family)